MNGDRRRLGTNLLIVGIVIFLIGAYSDFIIDWIYDWDSDIRIVGWGWILQLAGGLLAIYGLMIHLEEYLATSRQPPHPGMPQPFPLPPPFFMDRETKKVIWLLMIVALVVYILSPGLQCLTVIVILLVLVIIILILMGGRRPYYPSPQPYYPPSEILYPPKPAEPTTPPKAGKVKLCERCYAQLELDWTVCPFCGHSISPKPVDKND
jgi:hypothetical protein